MPLGVVMKRKVRQRRVQKNKARHSSSMKLIGSVVCFLILVLAVGGKSASAKNEAYMEQEQALIQQLEEEQNRTLEIEAYEAYVETDEYVEAVASEKLGLAYPDELILVPAN